MHLKYVPLVFIYQCAQCSHKNHYLKNKNVILNDCFFEIKKMYLIYRNNNNDNNINQQKMNKIKNFVFVY